MKIRIVLACPVPFLFASDDDRPFPEQPLCLALQDSTGGSTGTSASPCEEW